MLLCFMRFRSLAFWFISFLFFIITFSFHDSVHVIVRSPALFKLCYNYLFHYLLLCISYVTAFKRCSSFLFENKKGYLCKLINKFLEKKKEKLEVRDDPIAINFSKNRYSCKIHGQSPWAYNFSLYCKRMLNKEEIYGISLIC